ncbi:hypothetical protein KSP39_PZI012557 [Platanthera zijinensis]|uniref:Diphthine--ammonia ligase n=1 Tax=Platanthera zijinensis TaxID=2320716 RepID=A0AAP0BF04_9ASPA
MKVVALVSGGKDSCFAMMKCIDYGHEIVALANLMPVDDSVDELDSYMYQTVGHQIVIGYAECMGLPLFRRRIHGSSCNKELNYRVTPGDEVEDLFVLLNAVKHQIPSVTAVSSGAIASDYQRLRVESVCARLGLVSLAYLWKEDQSFLLEEMVISCAHLITNKIVAALGLNQKHLGQELVDLQSYLLQMKEVYGINVCGEGGEYETLTLDCPLFKVSSDLLPAFINVLFSLRVIWPRDIIDASFFCLENRKISFLAGKPLRSYYLFVLGKLGKGSEEEGEGFKRNPISTTYMENCDFTSGKHVKLCVSTRKRGTFSIGCWVPNSSACEGLQKNLVSILHAIELQLGMDGLDWAHVLYIHLYISDMKQFGIVNDVYMGFITEKKCYLGVPSRSTIEVSLAEFGLSNALVEVLVSSDKCKRVLHVQSISCWAPSCIGPYSQATLHKEVLYMAGQLGLDPPTMLLHPGGPTAEMDQALLNCEAVANCFKCSIATSSIFITVYCSAFISSFEMAGIQNRMEYFLKQNRAHNEGFLGACNPIILYVLVPNLPKRALVEVKPVLHLAENEQDEVQPILLKAPAPVILNHGDFYYFDWHNSCCQINVVPKKICMARISMAKCGADTIDSEADHDLISLHSDSSNRRVKAMASFFSRFIDKIISYNDFSWQDLKGLRFYFLKELGTVSDLLYPVFADAFSEFTAEFLHQNGKAILLYVVSPLSGAGHSRAPSSIGEMSSEVFSLIAVSRRIYTLFGVGEEEEFVQERYQKQIDDALRHAQDAIAQYSSLSSSLAATRSHLSSQRFTAHVFCTEARLHLDILLARGSLDSLELSSSVQTPDQKSKGFLGLPEADLVGGRAPDQKPEWIPTLLVEEWTYPRPPRAPAAATASSSTDMSAVPPPDYNDEYKKAKIADAKTMNILAQTMSDEVFQKVTDYPSAKAMWDALNQIVAGSADERKDKRIWPIKEAISTTEISTEALLGKLKSFEQVLKSREVEAEAKTPTPTRKEQTLALKAADASEGSQSNEELMTLFAKRFLKMGRKEFRKKSSKYEEKPRYDRTPTKEIICYGCRKPGHILPNCPEEKNKEKRKDKDQHRKHSKPSSYKNKKKERGFVAETWSDSDEESSSSSSSEDEEEKKAKEVCLMVCE